MPLKAGTMRQHKLPGPAAVKAWPRQWQQQETWLHWQHLYFLLFHRCHPTLQSPPAGMQELRHCQQCGHSKSRWPAP